MGSSAVYSDYMRASLRFKGAQLSGREMMYVFFTSYNAEKCDGKFVAGKVEVVIFVEKKMKILRYFDKL